MLPLYRFLASPENGSGGGASGNPAASAKNEKAGAPTLKKFTILAVDDEPMLVKAMDRIMRSLGHETKTAKDGSEALEIFRQGGIDLILSDYDMPNMNGRRLLEEAVKIDPGVRFICLTGMPSEERTKGMKDAGAFEVLVKPFDVDTVMRAVNAALASAERKMIGRLAEPLVDDGREAEEPAEASSEDPSAKGKNKHAVILVVDDNLDAREVLEASIGLMGYTALTASDGMQGLDIIRNSQVDLVVSDLQMPGMDGLAMLRQIKKEKPELKVILQSGRGNQPAVVQELLEAGAEAVLCKPVDLRYLETMIAKLI